MYKRQYYSYQIYAYHNASGEYDHANGTFNVKPTISLLNVRIPTYFVKKAGDTLQIYALLVSERGEPINFGTCYVNIYYPNGTTLLENQQMTLFYGGVYNYTWTTPNETGTYSFYTRCNTSTIFGYNFETIELDKFNREDLFVKINDTYLLSKESYSKLNSTYERLKEEFNCSTTNETSYVCSTLDSLYSMTLQISKKGGGGGLTPEEIFLEGLKAYNKTPQQEAYFSILNYKINALYSPIEKLKELYRRYTPTQWLLLVLLTATIVFLFQEITR